MTEVSENETVPIKVKWMNRQRVMVFCSRGTSYRDRHLMKNILRMLPHSKTESKIDKKQSIVMINEICEMRNCNKCIYFESRKRKDLYIWLSNVPKGPSVKFLVRNVHTMEELKMTGNCLKGSRPLLSFDAEFDKSPHWALLKELLIQTFATPNHHPQSQPFIDHVLTFSIADDRVWFRNYQIVQEDGELAEIGPRMVLEPIKIFEGSFCGPVLYENPNYTSPNELRRRVRLSGSGRYVARVQAKSSLKNRRLANPVTYRTDPTDDVFETEGADGVTTSTAEASGIQSLKRQIEARRKRKNAKKVKVESD